MQVITVNHDRYEKMLEQIHSSHKRSKDIQQRLKLVPAADSTVAATHPTATPHLRMPKHYDALNAGAAASAAASSPNKVPARREWAREHLPAAGFGQEAYTLMKMYTLSKEMVRTLLARL